MGLKLFLNVNFYLRYAMSRFLNYQNLRQCKGFPNELLEERSNRGLEDFRGRESFGNTTSGGSFGNKSRSSQNCGGGFESRGEVGKNWGFERGGCERGLSRNNPEMGGFGKTSEEHFGRERDFVGFGRGGGFGNQSERAASYSHKTDKPSFTIGSGESSDNIKLENNEKYDEMFGRGNSQFVRSRSGSEFNRSCGGSGSESFGRNWDMIDKGHAMHSSSLERMSRNEDDQSGFGKGVGVGSSFDPVNAVSGQFWQQMNPTGSSRGSRSYSVRGRKTNMPSLMDV